MKCARIIALLVCLAPLSCVAVRHEDPQGAAQFAASFSPNAADYVTTTAGAGVAGTRAPITASGPSGSFAPPPPPPPTAAGGSVVPTLPVTGAAGVVAAVGGSGGSGSVVAHAGAGPSAAGSGPTGMAGAGASSGTADHAGALTLNFKTVSQGGQYAPQNVGAVWIETDSGMFVKTLERWGSIRATHLTRWTMASGGWGSLFGGGNTADMMDAVSRATLRSHGAHSDMWDMKDVNGKVVADGKYQVVIEVTEDNFRAGASAAVPFDKGAMPVMVNAPDMAPWAGLTLSYQP